MMSALGQTFLGWSGACSGSAMTCTVPMNVAQSVGAMFAATTTATPYLISDLYPLTGDQPGYFVVRCDRGAPVDSKPGSRT